ncbi:unnamed protein product [Closterium sp. NIES-64]|nr:unnamed protein product [Closterium sp. NIES-64]CAI5969138.1 unnamed protein product [Closterium sp. NIES-65]
MASAVAFQSGVLQCKGLTPLPLASKKQQSLSGAARIAANTQLRSQISPSSSSAAVFSRQVRVCASAGRSNDTATSSASATETVPSVQRPARLTESVTEAVKAAVKPILAAALIASVLTGTPNDALAAQGGGRVGGSSFSASRANTYAPPAATYAAPPVVVAPVTPFFMPTPFFFFGPTISLGGGGGIFGFLFLAIAVYFIAQTVMGFLADSAEEEVWAETQRSSVVRLQVGLLGTARKLQRDLDQMASRADTGSQEGLHSILQETVLALLRNPDYCIYGFSTSETANDSYGGEAAFNRLSMGERSKFKEETLVNVGDMRKRSEREPSEQRMNSEYIVVTILAATEGTFVLPEVKSTADLREALTILGSIPADELQAVEVLWTPQNEEDTLTTRDMLEDYPSLRPL